MEERAATEEQVTAHAVAHVNRPTLAPASGASPVDPAGLRTLAALLLTGFVILACGLAYHQLARSTQALALARRQAERAISLNPPRGTIYDRERRVLAGNRVRVSAVLDLGELRREALRDEQPLAIGDDRSRRASASAGARLRVASRHLDRLNAITGRGATIDAVRLERAFLRERMSPFVLLDALTDDECERLGAVLTADGPIRLLRTIERWYPQGSTAAHVLGRVRSETMPATDSAKGFGLRTLSWRGARGESGVEMQYDDVLSGTPGVAALRIDAHGFRSGEPAMLQVPTEGGEVVLSLDLDLQHAAETALASTRGASGGAAVAVSVRTGEVLALASAPAFDLNDVSPRMEPAARAQIEKTGAWLNRATQGLYPPGSTFKVFTVLAGLRGGTLQPEAVVNCGGALTVGRNRFVCHNPQGHGPVSLRSALAHSCNIFAYHTGLAAGGMALADEARRFHLHEPTGIDLPFETRRMFVGDAAWKQDDGRGTWTTGDTLNTAIGQGYLRYTPLQAACAMASLARRETLTVSTLLYAPGRRPSGDRGPEPLGLSDASYGALVRSMEAVISTGIGRDAQVPGIRLAGKTGTAQVRGPGGTRNVAWFVAFAPVERPEIAIAVALEGAEPGVEYAGAAHAAPVVREIAGAYFDKRGAQRPAGGGERNE